MVIEARFARHPLLPLGIFRSRSLAIGNAIALTVGAALFGMFFFLSLYPQQVNGYSPLRAGLAFLPSGLAVMTGALSASRVVARLGPAASSSSAYPWPPSAWCGSAGPRLDRVSWATSLGRECSWAWASACPSCL